MTFLQVFIFVIFLGLLLYNVYRFVMLIVSYRREVKLHEKDDSKKD